jgi:hypothetical protein
MDEITDNQKETKNSDCRTTEWEKKYLNEITIWYITIFFLVNRSGDLIMILFDGYLPPKIFWFDKLVISDVFKYFMAPIVWAFIIAEVHDLFANKNKNYRLNRWWWLILNSPWIKNGFARILGIVIAVWIILWAWLMVMTYDNDRWKADTSSADQPIVPFSNE